MNAMNRQISPLPCLIAISCLAACGPPDRPPDVLLITVDTLRADHLGAYGFALPASPNIDRLANRSVVFERAIAASAATAPSHASIMTSLYPRHHSIGHANGPTTLTGETTLAEAFASKGYFTGAFIGNMILQRPSGLAKGFQHYDADLEEPEGERGGYLERTAERTTERALSWLDSLPDEPVFLWVHYQDPHGPYSPPETEAHELRLPPEPGEPRLPVLKNDTGLKGIPSYQALPGLFRASEYRSRYAGEILYADRWIGRLVESFEARDRDPIVLLTSDHGESFGEADRYFVHSYSTAPDNAHVPFLLSAPGLAAGRQSFLVSHVDVMPTLAELAGLSIEGTIDGVALGPVLRGEAPVPTERFVYCDMGNDVSAYRDDRFLQIAGVASAWNRGTARRNDIPDPQWEPYDWPPGETWRRRSPEGPLDESVRSYVLYAEEMLYLWELPAERQEALRAMGYGGE